VFQEPSGAYNDAVAYCNEQAHGAWKINLVALPTNADQQRELVVRRLAAKDSSVDIIGMDVIWTAEFASAGWIKPWPAKDAKLASEGVLGGPLASTQYRGAMWAAPFTSNTQLLWYRKDLVKTPPKTWSEMVADAKKLGSNGHIEEQGARYEGLTVWFNALVASAGGQIVDGSGNIVLGQPAVDAVNVLKEVSQSGVADPSLSNTKEDDARLAFEAGHAAFQLNWPYVYASGAADAKTSSSVKKVFDNMGWARYPAVIAGKPSRPPLGGVNLGIGSYTHHAPQAFAAALCLRSPHNQIIATVKGGLAPISRTVYDDPQVRKSYPVGAMVEQSLEDAAPRPVTPAYTDISLAIQDTLHPTTGIGDAQSTVNTLASHLKRVVNGGLY
jgi:multiple sugar transport system substrate-binding protein